MLRTYNVQNIINSYIFELLLNLNLPAIIDKFFSLC